MIVIDNKVCDSLFKALVSKVTYSRITLLICGGKKENLRIQNRRH